MACEVECLSNREQLFYERIEHYLRTDGILLDAHPTLRVLLEMWAQCYAEMWERMGPLERKARLLLASNAHVELLGAR